MHPCFVRASWLKLGSRRFSEPQEELLERRVPGHPRVFSFPGTPENEKRCQTTLLLMRNVGCEVALDHELGPKGVAEVNPESATGVGR